jgi:hypothetical protein
MLVYINKYKLQRANIAAEQNKTQTFEHKQSSKYIVSAVCSSKAIMVLNFERAYASREILMYIGVNSRAKTDKALSLSLPFLMAST